MLLLHAYVYGAVPPVTVKFIEPVLFPKHNTFTCVVVKAKPACGCVIITDVVSTHPFASVTVTPYQPAAIPVGSSAVPLFDHKNVYGAVPPVAVRLTDPVLFPKHNTFTCVVLNDNGACGCVIVTVWVVVHPFESVAVTV